ncbi:exonuclease domain-containing protein [Actinosynnema sp. NPDC023587]|uniref:exonuclease domain-containing protein n=1 Tax=Actinosynnema sp. NPDC023587 TaxID=3154695 RepID=UPI0033CDC545
MGYAVVDVETTGFAAGRSDRVVEIAVVLLDDLGRPAGEWCTLLNPGRDLGPQHVHRISAADVWDAPTFAQVAGTLARLLSGRVLVAHNLAFDARFLAAEFGRLGVDLAVDGLCTMRLAPLFLPGVKRSLQACCDAAGVVLDDAHSALHDARATGRLLAHYLRDGVLDAPTVPWPRLPGDDVAEVRRGHATVVRTVEDVPLTRGDLVVFTGQMTEPRDVWISRAQAAGLVSRGYVTRSTRVLVAADPFTLSGKARRARAYRVPIVSEDDFQSMVGSLQD